ncbi:MAG TPA: hypothetical protein VFB42_03980 [Gaiellaceae bacterium]|nr:hypothetical protein [Gaiellaceae bacterium]
MPRWTLPLLVAVPWVAGIWWAWHRRPRDGWVPPSMGERALRRLRST